MHDAANILRRYFNQLPEPIIPLDFYDRFRDPLRNHQAQAVGAIEAQSPSVGDFDQDATIRTYQALITELPPLNRQLLLYILDLLAVFASKSDLNKMTTPNLAAIFQPGILSHPQHDMAPQEYRLSQDVLIFLIENQDNFVFGMQGTAADPETVREVQSGSPSKTPTTPTTPNRARTAIERSASNASAGADSVRKWGGVRRNVSVSSKKSEVGPVPVVQGASVPTTPTSGVQRSNTLPSKRTGSAAPSPRFSRDKHSDPPTPTPGTTAASAAASVAVMSAPEAAADRQGSLQSTPTLATAPPFPAPPDVTSASSSEATTPLATIASDTSSAITRDFQTPKKDTTPLLAPRGGTGGEQQSDRSASNTPSTASNRGFLGILKQSPNSDGEGRKPNKLQKKRIPGSALSSAQSSSQSLQDEGSYDVAQRSPVGPSFPAGVTADSPQERGVEQIKPLPQNAYAHGAPQRNPTDATLKPTNSPTQSYHSTTDMSDADLVGDDLPPAAAGPPAEGKKKGHRFRFSRSQNKLDQPATSAVVSKDHTTSRSTLGSSAGSQPRRSFQEPTPLASAATDPAAGTAPQSQQVQTIQPSATDPVFSDSENQKKGPMSWLRGKIQERKDKDNEKRARTPERNRDRNESKQDLRLPSDAMPVRGKSLEQQRARESPQSGAQAMGDAAPAPAVATGPASSSETSPATGEQNAAR